MRAVWISGAAVLIMTVLAYLRWSMKAMETGVETWMRR